jgi:hypothetical protein
MFGQPASSSRLMAMLRAVARNCGDEPVRTLGMVFVECPVADVAHRRQCLQQAGAPAGKRQRVQVDHSVFLPGQQR